MTMQEYENNFYLWDEFRDKAAWDGFKYKNYTLMLDYLQKKHSSELVNTFLRMSKVEKIVFCARCVYFHHQEAEKREFARIWLEKKKGKTEVW